MSNETIEVFSQPGCVPCKRGKAWLEKNGIEFVERDVTVDVQALEELGSMGYMGAPVFRKGDEHFQGFDINKLKGFIA